jgi:hypothetical protein
VSALGAQRQSEQRTPLSRISAKVDYLRAAAARLKKLPAAEREAFLAKARKILCEYTIEDGKRMGRVLMKDLIDRTPAGHKVSDVDKALDATMRLGLKRLQDHEGYSLTGLPEFPTLFERGFWLGANEAVAECNNKPKQQPALPADAGATQPSV